MGHPVHDFFHSFFIGYFYLQTALHSACASGHHEVVKILLEAGAPTSKMYEESGEMKGNALTLAIAMHNRECVKVFLETATDSQGRNSIHLKTS